MAQRKGRAPSRLDAAGLWELALKSLTVRAYSNAELRTKLQARAVNIAEAGPRDHVCVPPSTREQAKEDNNAASSRRAKP
jgi:hypothetical protein